MAGNLLKLSSLPKTWLLDLDGTLVKHNGYKDGKDKILPGVINLLKTIPKSDFIIILTAREKEAQKVTETFLKENGVRYNEIIFEIPVGERILFNDCKPSGLKTAYAVNLERDEGLSAISIITDMSL